MHRAPSPPGPQPGEPAEADREPRPEPRRVAARRARAYLDACRALGLNPAARPLSVRRRHGEDVFLATARAADELAARHGVVRELVRGPALLTDGRDRLAFAECVARGPDGREARGAAVVPMAQPDAALMSAETQARALATLRVLGLESLAEPAREAVPAGYVLVPPAEVPMVVHAPREVAMVEVPMRAFVPASAPLTTPGAGRLAGPSASAVELPIRTVPMPTVFTPAAGNGPRVGAAAGAQSVASNGVPAFTTVSEPARARGELSEAMARFLAAVARLSRREDAAAVWLEHRTGIAALAPDDRRAAWSLICDKVARLGAGGDARAWLKQAVESARPG